MKQKLLALVCALALVVSLAGCVISTPDTVGSLGGYEISSGLYLLAQYDAYQKAADLASSDQDAANVKAFLKQTITVDSDSGETATVSDYVARKTLENLQTYAATELRFDELGGQLTAEEEQQADSYAQQLMDQYGDTYKANGIGLETVQHFERILLKSNDLLTLVYGNGGETPVSDADLTEHLENNMVELAYYVIPLYNTSTYAFADDDQKAQMLTLAQQAATAVNLASFGAGQCPERRRSGRPAGHLRRAGRHPLRHQCSDRAAGRFHAGLHVHPGRCRRYHPEPCLRAGGRRAVFQLCHDAGPASGPAGRGLAGRPAGSGHHRHEDQ